MEAPAHEARSAEPAAAGRVRIPLGRKILFALVPCVLVFALLELLCRVTGAGAPEAVPPSSADARTVELAAPDGRRSVYKEGVYVGQPIRTNEKGFRDWLYEPENREGALRIAAVGDSFTFGDGLSQDDTWLRRLEPLLAPRLPAGRVLRTMNFGRRGANTAEELSMLEGHVLPFHPDLVVLDFTVFNDAETAAARTASTKSVVAREQSGLWRMLKSVHDGSHLVNFVSDRLRRRTKRAEMAAHIESEYADDAPGWLECRESLAKFAATCRDRRVPLIVLIFPSHHRDPALNDWAHYDFASTHAKIKAALAPFPEVAVVDMADHLKDLSGRTIWIEGNGHPDAVYAQRAAEALVAPAVRLLGLSER